MFKRRFARKHSLAKTDSKDSLGQEDNEKCKSEQSVNTADKEGDYKKPDDVPIGLESTLSTTEISNVNGKSDLTNEVVNENNNANCERGGGSFDVMISYSHTDKDVMRSIKDYLVDSGLNVWVDEVGLQAGVNFLSKIGEAIVDAKTFVILLSEDSVRSKYCQDELALAYISNKPILPVSLVVAKEIMRHMDTGMRLQLAGMKWVIMDEQSDFTQKAGKLLKKLNKRITITDEAAAQERASEDTEKETVGVEVTGAIEKFKRSTHRYRFYTRVSKDDDEDENDPDDVSDVEDAKRIENPNQFWDRHFKDKIEVPWTKFLEAFSNEFQEDLTTTYSIEDQRWLKGILYNEMEVEETDGMLDKTMYLSFCTVEDELLALWKRVEEQARESYAMREVFDMQSSVRIQAIENLAKIKGAAVMDALRDLLEDPDPNVRAVAAISLAKLSSSDKVTIRKLLKTLNDKDRLVREAGCIALGRLKAEAAVPRLVHIWRNDVMSSVRNAAEVALTQISGPEVEKSMHIIGILTQEIHMLTQ